MNQIDLMDDGKRWSGFKFPMGTFIVWTKDGYVAMGKCDPITEEVLEWFIIKEKEWIQEING